MRLVRLLLRVDRAVARVLHRQRARDDQHFAQRLLVARGENHPADARIERQTRKLAAELGQRVVVVDGAEFVEQLIAVGDCAPRRRLDERERFDRRQMQRLHPQDDGGERRTQNLGVREARPPREVGLFVETNTDAVGDAAAAPCPLVRGRLRDRLDLQLLDLVAVRVALHAREARVDHITDAGHRQRRFGDVGREHDAPRVRRTKHALLFGRGKPREQRQDFRVRRMVLAQRLGRVANLAFAWQEHEHVAGAFAAQLVGGFDDCVHQIAIRLALRFRTIRPVAALTPFAPRVAFRRFHGRRILGDGAIAHLDGIQTPAHFDHGRGLLFAAKMTRKTVGVDGRRRHDQLQIGTLRQDFLQIAEQKIDVQAALVRFVDDERVVGLQQRIGLRFREQNAVRHQLDGGARREIIGETHLVADHFAKRRAEFLGDAPTRRRRRDPARLRVADQAAAARAESASERETNLRQLGRLARARLAADDHDLMARNRARDFLASAGNGQRFRERDGRNWIRLDYTCGLMRFARGRARLFT